MRLVDHTARKRKLLRERECRLCGRPPVSGHHLIPRSQGGDDMEDNIIPLCGSGTTGCHGLIEAHNPIARAALGSRLKQEEIAYAISKLGREAAAEWLRRHYHLREVK